MEQHRSFLSVVMLCHCALAQASWSTLAQVPSLRDSAFVYDAARAHCLLFGGFGTSGGYYGGTRQWDGSQWTTLNPANSPSPRGGSRMVYDPARQRVLMFGGFASTGASNQLWAWNGVDWTQIATGGAVPGSSNVTGHRLVLDPVRDRLVLLSGFSSFAVHELNLATGQWTNPTPVAPWPFFQNGFAATFDPVANRTTVFIGGSTSTYLWRWNGSSWTSQTTSTATSTTSMELVFDPVQQRLLMVGGTGNATLRAWNATTAQWQVVATDGPATYGHGVAYDEPRQAVVAVGAVLPSGGLDSSIWEWTGGPWQKRATGAPAPRSNHTVAADRAAGRLYVYGGGSEHGDLWMQEQGVWQIAVPRPSSSDVPGHPGSVDGSRLVFDEQRGELLLIGGQVPAATFPFWRRTGSTWQNIAVATPPPRTTPGVAYDSKRQRVIMFGGVHQAVQRNDTWSWNGQAWSQLFPLHVPTASAAPGLAYDRVRDRIVAVVGSVIPSTGGTWEFDGVDWQLRAPGPSPTLRGHELVYDEARQVTVALWQSSDNVPMRTMQWDGVAWTEIAATQVLPGRFRAALVSHGDELLVTGGNLYFGEPCLEWRALRTPWLARFDRFGADGATSIGALSLAGGAQAPWLGATVRVRLTGLPQICLPALWAGASNTEWMGVPLPIDLGGLGWPESVMRIAPDVLVGMLSLGDGSAHSDIVVPYVPALLGAQLHFQALAFEPVLGGLGTSNGLTMTFGSR